MVFKCQPTLKLSTTNGAGTQFSLILFLHASYTHAQKNSITANLFEIHIHIHHHLFVHKNSKKTRQATIGELVSDIQKFLTCPAILTVVTR